MSGAYGTPCAVEIRFWESAQHSLRELVHQTTRIADALEARNRADGIDARKDGEGSVS